MVSSITAYFKDSDWLLKKLPWTAKPRLLCERALKTVSETNVKSDLAFCLGPSIEKTNSASIVKEALAKEYCCIGDHTFRRA